MKRTRGGQKGNQNARKHGFYSRDLNPAELSEFWNIITLEKVDPEIALIRVKLRSSLRQDPANRRVLREAANLLTKWNSEKLRLDKTDSRYLKEIILGILESYQPDHPAHTELVEGSKEAC